MQWNRLALWSSLGGELCENSAAGCRLLSGTYSRQCGPASGLVTTASMLPRGSELATCAQVSPNFMVASQFPQQERQGGLRVGSTARQQFHIGGPPHVYVMLEAGGRR